MQKINEIIGTSIILSEAKVKRKSFGYSQQLGVGIHKEIEFGKNSVEGHVVIDLVFFDATTTNSKDELGKDELERKSQAEINLNYQVTLPDGVVYKVDNDSLIWQYIYPQVKVDVAIYCNSIGLPGFILPIES